MTDGHVTMQFLKVFFLENLSHQTHVTVHAYLLAVRRSYSRALLPPVLEREEPKERHSRDVLTAATHPKHSALFLYLRPVYL